MLVVVSPAKRLDWAARDMQMTTPDYLGDANRLAGHARALRLRDLKSLMSLSDDLARLNRDRFRAFAKEPEDQATRPALYAFAGDTYLGFDAATLDAAGRERAQSHMRILSGLYGLLRPMDAIQPYRLEMGSRLKTRRGTNLYHYWGKELAKGLNRQAEEAGSKVLVNCASQEYFGAVDLKALKLKVVTPQFYEVTNGTPKMVSFFAKQARGAMARFVVDHRVQDVAALEGFAWQGYRFQGAEDGKLIFHRAQEAAA